MTEAAKFILSLKNKWERCYCITYLAWRRLKGRVSDERAKELRAGIEKAMEKENAEVNG